MAAAHEEVGLDQFLPLVNVLVGLIAGLAAPYVGTSLEVRRAGKDRERKIAEAILALFQSPRSLTELLREDRDNCRRQLIILALKLNDDEARKACLELVRVATSGASDDDLFNQWTAMAQAVAELVR